MNANHMHPDPLGGDVRPVSDDGEEPHGEPARDARCGPDRVEISDAARSAANETVAAARTVEPLDPGRLAALRRWVADGGPADPAVAERVAERLLASGDL